MAHDYLSTYLVKITLSRVLWLENRQVDFGKLKRFIGQFIQITVIHSDFLNGRVLFTDTRAYSQVQTFSLVNAFHT